MSKHWISATVGVLGLLLCPAISSAQFAGGRGGGGFGGGGYYSPNVSGIFTGPNYYPYGTGRSGPGYYAPPTSSYYSSPGYYYSPTAYYYTPSPAPNTAAIEVKVPPNAEIWFDGDKTSQTGSVRTFESPPLEPGRTFTYDIRARWTGADGKVVDQSRKVRVEAGRRSDVDFRTQ